MSFIQSHVHVGKNQAHSIPLVSNACVTFVIASESMPQILQTVSSLAYKIILYSLHYRMEVSEKLGGKMVPYTTEQKVSTVKTFFKHECCASAEKLLTTF